MSLEQQIYDDLVTAMREGDEVKKGALRLVRAEIKNASIDAGGALDDDAVRAILEREAKKRRDTIRQYEDAGRDELVPEERAALAVIETYLPRQLTPEEIEAAAREQIAATGASGPGDMAKVMPPLMGQLAGRADGRQVSEIVRRLLAAE